MIPDRWNKVSKETPSTDKIAIPETAKCVLQIENHNKLKHIKVFEISGEDNYAVHFTQTKRHTVQTTYGIADIESVIFRMVDSFQELPNQTDLVEFAEDNHLSGYVLSEE